MNIRIGGVPEHFNLPWELALENGLFQDASIDLVWTYYAGGTGAMTKALARGDLDMAILLTEGFISAVHAGLEARIAKVYIDTPLYWGIHTAADNDIAAFDDARPYKYAISRFGSGSHLMAMIHAEHRHLLLEENDFAVVNSLHGAVDSLSSHASDIFYWEPFMTQPFVKSGKLKRIGGYHAPWSGFLVVASDDAIATKQQEIRAVLDLMNKECMRFKLGPNTVHQLTHRFEMNAAEAGEWLENTQWNNNFNAELELLVNARNALTKVKACDKSLRVEQLCANWVSLI